MRIDKHNNLKPGIYRVFWKGTEGTSIAEVGVGSNGENWLAPTNWVEPATSAQACHPHHPSHWSWATVERVELLIDANGEVLLLADASGEMVAAVQ